MWAAEPWAMPRLLVLLGKLHVQGGLANMVVSERPVYHVNTLSDQSFALAGQVT